MDQDYHRICTDCPLAFECNSVSILTSEALLVDSRIGYLIFSEFSLPALPAYWNLVEMICWKAWIWGICCFSVQLWHCHTEKKEPSLCHGLAPHYFHVFNGHLRDLVALVRMMKAASHSCVHPLRVITPHRYKRSRACNPMTLFPYDLFLTAHGCHHPWQLC